jgi:hypothetical protein
MVDVGGEGGLHGDEVSGCVASVGVLLLWPAAARGRVQRTVLVDFSPAICAEVSSQFIVSFHGERSSSSL